MKRVGLGVALAACAAVEAAEPTAVAPVQTAPTPAAAPAPASAASSVVPNATTALRKPLDHFTAGRLQWSGRALFSGLWPTGKRTTC